MSTDQRDWSSGKVGRSVGVRGFWTLSFWGSGLGEKNLGGVVRCGRLRRPLQDQGNPMVSFESKVNSNTFHL